jgi:gamma-glutamyltranspeptidase/glutathione hydrolase
VLSNPELATTLERLAAEGAEPFYAGDIAEAAVARVTAGGGTLTLEDLAAYEATPREPIQVAYRGHDVFTNPPPSAGGILIAYVLALLEREPAPPSQAQLVAAMEAAQRARTPDFLEGLARPGFLGEFMSSQLGSTTHISVLDGDGRACAVTCTNGEGSGVFVPGTGIHLNNMMGEEDLSPLGFFTHPPGQRLPSMMAPTVVERDGEVMLALGSAGSNRIRSAILQVILGVIDRGLDLRDAVEAPRVHWEEGVVYAEPGAEGGAEGWEIARFDSLNVFFGGAQAVRRDPATGEVVGAGDPRRGGAVVMA